MLEGQDIINTYTETSENIYQETDRAAAFNQLTYPLNRQSEQRAWIRFTPVKYKVAEPAEEDVKGVFDAVSNNAVVRYVLDALPPGLFFGSDAKYENLSAAQKKLLEEEVSRNPVFNDIRPVGGREQVEYSDYRINLYLPENISVADGVNYGEESLNILGQAANDALRAAGDIGIGQIATSALGAITQDTLGLIGTVFTGSTVDRYAALSISRALQSSGNKYAQRIRGGVRSAFGVALNPNLRNLLTGVGIRQFSFTFKFIPESAKEAETIQNIIDTFRTEAYPESLVANYGSYQSLKLGYEFPRLFLITMYYINEDGIPIILPFDVEPCFLKNISVTHNSNNFGWHEDGRPSESQITLSFIEERTLDKQRVMERITQRNGSQQASTRRPTTDEIRTSVGHGNIK